MNPGYLGAATMGSMQQEWQQLVDRAMNEERCSLRERVFDCRVPRGCFQIFARNQVFDATRPSAGSSFDLEVQYVLYAVSRNS